MVHNIANLYHQNFFGLVQVSLCENDSLVLNFGIVQI